MTRIALLFVVLAGCASEVADFPPLGDYTTWERRDTKGTTPGHGDTYRVIFANDIATTYVAGFGYPEGSTIVKEVYARDGEGPGKLSVIEIMRREGPHKLDGEGGWVFTAASEPNGQESLKENFCWRRCHQAAPFEGAWFDYSVDPL